MSSSRTRSTGGQPTRSTVTGVALRAFPGMESPQKWPLPSVRYDRGDGADCQQERGQRPSMVSQEQSEPCYLGSTRRHQDQPAWSPADGGSADRIRAPRTAGIRLRAARRARQLCVKAVESSGSQGIAVHRRLNAGPQPGRPMQTGSASISRELRAGFNARGV
jgi:hypothetical protein